MGVKNRQRSAPPAGKSVIMLRASAEQAKAAALSGAVPASGGPGSSGMGAGDVAPAPPPALREAFLALGGLSVGSSLVSTPLGAQQAARPRSQESPTKSRMSAIHALGYEAATAATPRHPGAATPGQVRGWAADAHRRRRSLALGWLGGKGLKIRVPSATPASGCAPHFMGSFLSLPAGALCHSALAAAAATAWRPGRG